MELDNQLRDLVKKISPTATQQKELKDAHIRLRERLMSDDNLKPLLVGTFLQGSYRRHTGIKPEAGDKPDVDVVVVTRLDRHDYTPEQALNTLVPFLYRHSIPNQQPMERRAVVDPRPGSPRMAAHPPAGANPLDA